MRDTFGLNLAWPIGDTLGGGKIFKRLGVNERRRDCAVICGDKNVDVDGIGDSGNNGEFGV